mmetsp:Transcript_68010/g.181008  ORF Transcript_68010/g.181008 Transcript_68010/m.181008 type:complete len:144 (+) Transcript_68010:581-1012(+)
MLLKGLSMLSKVSKVSILVRVAPRIAVREPLVVRALPVRRMQAMVVALAAPVAYVSAAACAAGCEEDELDVALRGIDEHIASEQLVEQRAEEEPAPTPPCVATLVARHARWSASRWSLMAFITRSSLMARRGWVRPPTWWAAL